MTDTAGDRFEDFHALDAELYHLAPDALRSMAAYFGHQARRCLARAEELDRDRDLWSRARERVAAIATAEDGRRLVREARIMRLARRGWSTAEIAQHIACSPATVHRTITRVLGRPTGRGLADRA